LEIAKGVESFAKSAFMAHSPRTYEDWLALSDDEKREVHSKEWNVYARDGIAIAFMAATRLALQCGKKVSNIQIGTYHCGEYLLQLTVSEQEFLDCPPMLAESFEGFRVVWCPPRIYVPPPDVPGTLEGTWRAEEGDYEFELRLTGSGVDVTGRVVSTGEELCIQDPILNQRWVLFSARLPDADTEEGTDHVFALVTPDRCGNRMTRLEYYRRVSQ
jgi:hypothetical protein